jgi:hypothetical protein
MDTKYYLDTMRLKESYQEMSEEEFAEAKPVLESYEEQMFGFVMFLCY